MSAEPPADAACISRTSSSLKSAREMITRSTACWRGDRSSVARACRAPAGRRAARAVVRPSSPTGSRPYSGCWRILRSSGAISAPSPTNRTRSGPRTRSRCAHAASRRKHDASRPTTPNDERLDERAAGRPGEQLEVDPEQQAADQERVEEPREVVERRVADPLDVAVVEAVELEQEQPDRERRRGRRAGGRAGSRETPTSSDAGASASAMPTASATSEQPPR